MESGSAGVPSVERARGERGQLIRLLVCWLIRGRHFRTTKGAVCSAVTPELGCEIDALKLGCFPKELVLSKHVQNKDAA